MRIRIFHTNDFRNAGFEPTTHVTEVLAYDASDHITATAALEQAFFRFNVGDDPAYGEPDPLAVSYRQRGNRSLSVGDVVAIDDTFYLCASAGWTEITAPTIENAATHGTTPIEAPRPVEATLDTPSPIPSIDGPPKGPTMIESPTTIAELARTIADTHAMGYDEALTLATTYAIQGGQAPTVEVDLATAAAILEAAQVGTGPDDR